MSAPDDVVFESFELAADAWDWLDANGFMLRLSAKLDFPGHLEFDHPDGRWAIMYLPPHEDGDQETELKIFGR